MMTQQEFDIHVEGLIQNALIRERFAARRPQTPGGVDPYDRLMRGQLFEDRPQLKIGKPPDFDCTEGGPSIYEFLEKCEQNFTFCSTTDNGMKVLYAVSFLKGVLAEFFRGVWHQLME